MGLLRLGQGPWECCPEERDSLRALLKVFSSALCLRASALDKALPPFGLGIPFPLVPFLPSSLSGGSGLLRLDEEPGWSSTNLTSPSAMVFVRW